jgi:aminoglycoside phosphotransferase (APT) family kinase protein
VTTGAVPGLDQDLLAWLLARGLVRRADVVDGDLVLRDLSSRNLNVLVERPGGRSFLVKQARGTTGTATLEREAARYRALSEAGLDSLAPAFHDFDPEEGVLVLEGIPGATDLRAYHRDATGFPAAIGASLGDALARLHDGTDEASPVEAPWVLSIHRPTVEGLGDMTPATIDLVKIVQAEPGIGEALDALQAAWTPTAPVHNDLKWDNVLIEPGSAPPDLWVVDWEHAGRGDPLWDVGSAIAAYLSAWLFSIDGRPGDGPEALPERAKHPLDGMVPAMSAIWTAYAARRPEPRLGDSDAERVIRYAGARLLGTAYEVTQTGADVNAHLVLHVQVAANMLQQPRSAAPRLGLAERALATA